MGIRKDDIVRIKPEWRDQGDERILFVAVEDEEASDQSATGRYVEMVECL